MGASVGMVPATTRVYLTAPRYSLDVGRALDLSVVVMLLRCEGRARPEHSRRRRRPGWCSAPDIPTHPRLLAVLLPLLMSPILTAACLHACNGERSTAGPCGA